MRIAAGLALDRRRRRGIGQHQRGRVARDRVAARAAVERDDPQRRARRAGRGASTLIAFARPSAMSPPEWPPRPRSPSRAAARRRAGSRAARKPHVRVGAAGAADGERAVLLAVEVEQHVAARSGPGPGRGAPEPDLLGDGHQQLERAVLARVVLRDRQHRGDRDAVVGAERRPLRPQPVAVAHQLDPPGARVVRTARLALADHVEVALEDHRRARASRPRRRRHADDEVSGSVARVREAALLGPGDDVRDGLLLLVRGPWDPRQRGEVAPERRGLEAGEEIGHPFIMPTARTSGLLPSRRSRPRSGSGAACRTWGSGARRARRRVQATRPWSRSRAAACPCRGTRTSS